MNGVQDTGMNGKSVHIFIKNILWNEVLLGVIYGGCFIFLENKNPAKAGFLF
ncbi:hypothetical protein V5098_03650 [Vibrio coralliirubri]